MHKDAIIESDYAGCDRRSTGVHGCGEAVEYAAGTAGCTDVCGRCGSARAAVCTASECYGAAAVHHDASL